jgi:hypothetical protein
MRAMVPKLEQSERHKANAKLRGITNEASKLTTQLVDAQPGSQREELFAGSSSARDARPPPSSAEQAFADSAARVNRIIDDVSSKSIDLCDESTPR